MNIDFKQQIGWKSESELVIQYFGYEIHKTKFTSNELSHEGHVSYLLKSFDRYAVFSYRYGRCYRCDAYAGYIELCENTDDLVDLFVDDFLLFDNYEEAYNCFNDVIIKDDKYCRVLVEGVDLSRFIPPNIRQVYATLIANEIVSVQPITLPSASLFYMPSPSLFYMDYSYGKDNDDD